LKATEKVNAAAFGDRIKKLHEQAKAGCVERKIEELKP
jgi:hypothetical protein